MVDNEEWAQLVRSVLERYCEEHPGERHTLEEWADILREDVYREDMARWYAKHPEYVVVGIF